ncbi:multimeric flavodoxin WrbA [Clostridium pascui]|uniref:flavodoxin family protein n=1 Tax=Clostridium pascui TaxID=46609 RepID=UPI00195CC223|nr:flavodoxin family protein [Clostridium pascui]MBM7870402.1 multimeric flavodoxin WrbA [Clostridium pascui]
MCKRKILAIAGSNHKQSLTNMLMKGLLNEIKTLNESYEAKVICLRDYKIDYCIGCKICFYEGFCPMDEQDDFTIIRNELLESDIIFFASPVYVHNVSGIMKTFFDRISASTHLMNYAGKIGFTLTTTESTGQDDVKKYLIKMQEAIGIKNLDNYVFSNENSTMKQFVKTNGINFLKSLENNYGYTNRILEWRFGFFRNLYGNMINQDLGKEKQETFELDYWNQIWIKECRSFQEFAIKNRIVASSTKNFLQE